MDGRVQLPVIRYLQKRFGAEYVDSITDAGPNLVLSEGRITPRVQAILERLKISIEKHGSVGVAIVGHYDCAGNPAPAEAQIIHIHKGKQLLREYCGDIEVIGLWVDEDFRVHEVAGHEAPV
jgi:hypothetical protein